MIDYLVPGPIEPFGEHALREGEADSMRDPLPEAYELVEHGVITPDNFRDFTFANAVHLWGAQNPRFFEGTKVAKEAAAVLNATPSVRAAAD